MNWHIIHFNNQSRGKSKYFFASVASLLSLAWFTDNRSVAPRSLGDTPSTTSDKLDERLHLCKGG